MKRLTELVDIVRKNKVKSIEIIGNNLDSESKLMQFYQGIHDGKITSDEEALELLYPKMDNRNAYYKLKHVLNERLRNTLFFIDIKKNKFSNIKRAYLECQQMIGHFNLLLNKGARANALYVGAKALKIAEAYEFTQEIIYISRNLAANYALVSGDRKKYLELSQKVFSNKEVFVAETMAEMYFTDLLSLYVKDRSTKTYVYQQAKDYLEHLQPYRDSVHTSNFHFSVNMLRAIKYMSINDYGQCYSITNQALSDIRSYRFFNTRAFGTLSFQYIACCIQLKKYREGVRIIRELQQMIDPGTFNWYKVQELHFTLSLHSGNYQEADRIYRRVRKESNFNNLVANTRETWIIYGAWIHLLRVSGRITDTARSQIQPFRIQKFLNEVPIFARDKRGLNVPILICHILLLLQQKKYHQLIDRLEAIEKYRDRYLNQEDNLRSNIFIRMLSLMAKYDFRRRVMIQRAQPLLAKLHQVSLEIANQSHDLEILPYEDTWEMLLQLLDRD